MGKQGLQPSRLSLTLLALTVSGCAVTTPAPPAEPERWPALPPQGRASLVLTPSECLLSCLSGLTAERKRSRDTLTGSGLLDSSASGAGTR